MRHEKIEVFYKYFMSFYGEEGIYPIKNFTRMEVKKAIKCIGNEFIGDSFDREKVRNILKNKQFFFGK